MMTTQPMKSIKTEIGAKHLVAGNNAHKERMDELASVFRCNVGRLPMKYLGLSVLLCLCFCDQPHRVLLQLSEERINDI